MNAECIIASYKQFMKEYQPRWIFGNSVLYKMCKDYPTHEDSEINIGKIWLIGRSYAAAVERRKEARESNDDFYYNVVSKAMYVIHEKLDNNLRQLNESQLPISDEIELSLILETHYCLTNTFNSITSLDKRSLASKYLHFHCPEKFYIYDTRACETVRRIIPKGRHSKLTDSSSPGYWKYGELLSGKTLDLEYGEFVCRMLALRECLQTCEQDIATLTPRKLDDFLLWLYEERRVQ